MSITTSSVIARPIGKQRQAIVSYGDNHIVVGSPAIRDTLSDYIRSTDLLLAALATDCTFVCQEEAQQLDIPLQGLTTSVRWVYPASADSPEIVVRLAWSGPKSRQTTQILDAIRTKCQTYRLLAKAIPITFEIVD